MASVPPLAEFNVVRGLNYSESPNSLPLGTLVDARNVRGCQGRLRTRPGYTMVKSGGLGARARFAFFFRNAAGTVRLIACTPAKMWNYDSATNTFEDRGDFASSADNAYYDAAVWGGTLYLVKRGGDAWKWNGVAAGDFTDVTASLKGPTFLRAFNSRLLGAHCTVGGNTLAQSLYWSAPDLPENWTGAGSGNETRRALQGEITGLENVGRGVALFAEESIEMIGETSEAAAPYTFTSVEPTLGTGAPHSICKLGSPYSGNLAFLGSDLNLHVFTGNRAEAVGYPIHSLLKGIVERDYLAKAWGRVWDEEGVYMLALPTCGSTENNLLIEWQYRENRFFVHDWAGTDKAWTAAARWVKSSPLTWAQLRTATTTWAQLRAAGLAWGELRKATGRREIAFLGSTGSLVAPWEGTSDNGVAISAYAEFAPTDGGSPDTKELQQLEILDDRLGASNVLSVTVKRSMDAGASSQVTTRQHTLGGTQDPFVDVGDTGRYFGLKFSMAGLNQVMSLRGLRLWGQKVGEER